MTDDTNPTPRKDFFKTETSDFIRFLSENTDPTCPACKNQSWTIMREEGEENTYRFGLMVRNVERRPYVSIFSTFCTKCGFMRSHLARIVHDWVKANPDEQLPLELEAGEHEEPEDE